MMPATARPAECSQAEFARLLGYKASYVTELKQAGRLVLTDDGKRVRVAESIARIEATRDPAHAAVAARHAAQREATAATVAAPPAEPPPAPPGEADYTTSTGYAYWRERSEKAKALAVERDNQIAEGKLLDAAQVEGAVANAAARLRSQLEALPYDLAPELAAITDEAQVRARLIAAVESVLGELARQFAGASRSNRA